MNAPILSLTRMYGEASQRQAGLPHGETRRIAFNGKVDDLQEEEKVKKVSFGT
jgi:hypothetical protein